MSDSLSKYLQYLPDIYQSPDNSLFIANYLKIFEKIFTGIADKELNNRKAISELLSENIIGEFFHPRWSFLFNNSADFIPPISGLPHEQQTEVLANLNAYLGFNNISNNLSKFISTIPTTISWQEQTINWINDFLAWLASWFDLTLDQNWSIDKKRLIIAMIMPIYRLRGTQQGLQQLLNLFLDLPITFSENTANSSTDKIEELLTIDVEICVANPFLINDNPKGTFMVDNNYQLQQGLLNGAQPWLFIINVNLPNFKNPDYILTQTDTIRILQIIQQLTILLKRFKPEFTQYQLHIYPSMELTTTGQNSQLSINTLLGSVPST